MCNLYNNNFVKTKENITDDDIKEIEKMYKFDFPEEIRRHYLTYNGGEPEKYVFIDDDGDEYIVQKFISIEKKGSNDLKTTLDRLRVSDSILPDWLIPIAVDPGGNMYCFSLMKKELGSIYFWNHEYEYGENQEDNIIYLADSLKEFIESLVEDY